ncbi:toll/interleukin-1 receptor domain-containing protein [Candidatus Venteria ishoeyi]|uniref:TIR domain-containing protein n=1 Tax=Candidatus Venteria ishoeyi TaxID=1899563 RepID=A0A1H6FH85_9GAMM|nr:toll/interleukin-1 receptor domain-containing protein [Candidatus Venteria ishoeyi]SEH08719.1 Uncharacterised protein [Candidatus Venteria ishoeyi]
MSDKKDFFISYNGKDQSWAEWVAWEVEQMGYSAIIQAWDFNAGGNFVNAMQEAAKNAQRTIAVLSQNYLDAQFTHPEWHAAFRQDPKGEKGLLIPVRIGECDLDGLLSQIVYIDLVGVDEKKAGQALREQLKSIITGKRRKPQNKPVFPGAETANNDKPAPSNPVPAPPQIEATQETPDTDDLSTWLYDRLTNMLSSMLDEVIFKYRVPNGVIADGVGQATKVKQLLQYAEEKETTLSVPKLRGLVEKITGRTYPN